jgi:signal transduction histidine kinase
MADLAPELEAAARRGGAPEPLLVDFRGALTDSRTGAERIRGIAQSMREFAHVDAAEARPTDVARVREDALRLCWNEIKMKAEVRRDFAPLPPVRAHPERLCQVFTNLLVNAAQAIERRGVITLSARVEASEQPSASTKFARR